ncbi:hypothetical protein L596_002741 [Steinernema carpocapsae]|uniref:dual-specificity kinase n=1 Tax=Steinernema carpocapsae TaxID=34508 RepID=A0A4U8UQL1_STECR|nr:hypothetical protein L596_002741 [Steinernema carpocapsae]
MMVHPAISEPVDIDSGPRFRQYPSIIKESAITGRFINDIHEEIVQTDVIRSCSPVDPIPSTSSESFECCTLRYTVFAPSNYDCGNDSSCAEDCETDDTENGKTATQTKIIRSHDKENTGWGRDRPRLHSSSSFEVLRNDIGPLHSKDDFLIESHLGGGFFGDVYKILKCDDPGSEPLVMKVAKIDESRYGVNSRLRAKRNVLHEARILQRLQHSNIVRSRGGCVELNGDRWDIHLLVDYCDMGSLHCMILGKHIEMPWLLRFGVALDIANAMKFVHDQGFIHRDLTSMNILLQSCRSPHEIKAVVADFGLSCERPTYPHRLQQVGTLNWMAPETLKEEYYDEKADVFAFGVILCQMIARIDADHDAGLYRSHLFGLDYIRFTAHCPSDTPLDVLKLAFWCCLMNPTSRPSFSKIHEQLSAMIEMKRSEEDGRTNGSGLNSSYRATSCCEVPDARLGRSHSDAALRPAELYAQSTGKPLRSGTALSSTTSVLVEGVIFDTDGFESTRYSDSPRSIENRMKQLALSVANEDPDYAESESNPFRTNDRKRGVRKFTPKWNVEDLEQQVVGSEECTEKRLPAFDYLRCPMSVKHNKKASKRLRRTASMPNFASGVPKSTHPEEEDVALSLPSKRINNTGIGAQRDLQGKMTLTFRDYDQKFTSLRYPSRRRATIEKENSKIETLVPPTRFLVSVKENVPAITVSSAGLPTRVRSTDFHRQNENVEFSKNSCIRGSSKLSVCVIM